MTLIKGHSEVWTKDRLHIRGSVTFKCTVYVNKYHLFCYYLLNLRLLTLIVKAAYVIVTFICFCTFAWFSMVLMDSMVLSHLLESFHTVTV